MRALTLNLTLLNLNTNPSPSPSPSPNPNPNQVARVLRPGGKLILSQSNRCFFTKAVGVWTADMSDSAHLRLLGTYIHFEPKMSEPSAFDISPKGPGTNDPMYIVEATRA